jgi:hypothetical protein
MIKFIIVVFHVAYIGAGILSVKQSVESYRANELREVRYKAALKILYKKYQWKSDRLKVYTDLVYNVNGGAIYEK